MALPQNAVIMAYPENGYFTKVPLINHHIDRGFRNLWYPQIIHFNRIFPYNINHPFGGPPSMETSI